MLSTPCVPVEELIAHAHEEAAALECGWVGTEHLLLAMLQRDADLSGELLRCEGLELEVVRAAALANLDPEAKVETGEEPQATGRLLEVQGFAHEHAVLLESEAIYAGHLLLAIAISGEGRAAAILDELGEETRERLEEALTDSLAGGEPASSAPLSITAREAAALAWSRALAVGREEVEVDDLLRGICAPGWTIGARALAALGSVPDWAPALWTGEPSEDPYRRIPFDATTRGALRAASEQAAQLGRDYIGTEHLLLGIAAVAIEQLEELVDTEVGEEGLRNAIADAVSSSEEAQDTEARQRGWTPEEDAKPNLIERMMAGAREVAEKTGEATPDNEQPPSCWHGFLAAILTNEDEDLAEVLDDLMLEPAEIHALGKGEEDVPFADAVALAKRRRRGAEPEPVDLILATVAIGSPRLLAALDSIGLTGAEVEAQLAEWRLRQEGDASGSSSVLAASALNLLAGGLASAALALAVIDQGAWWKLIFLWLIWSGYPGYGPFGSTVVVAVLAFAVSPLVGAIHLLGIPADVIQARAERQEIWARTGVRLNLRELRCVKRRNLGMQGQVNQGVRQIARSTLPAWLRRPRWRRTRS